MVAYTLDQAQRDIAALRGQIAHLQANATFLNVNVATQLTLPDGGIWTSAGPSGGSPWQVGRTQASTATHTLGNSASVAILSDAWTIPAGDAKVGSTYVIEVPLVGTQETANLHLGVQFNGSGSTDLCPVGTVVVTVAGHGIVGTARVYFRCTATGSGGNMACWIDGVLSDSTINRGNVPGLAVLTGYNGTNSFNTTISNTIAMEGFWSATSAGQTITGNGSTYIRMGP